MLDYFPVYLTIKWRTMPICSIMTPKDTDFFLMFSKILKTKSDIIDLMNITEVLSKIEIDQAEIDVVYKTILNGTF